MESTQDYENGFISFVKKYAWAFSIGFALLAIVFLFLPVLNYEIREAVYDIATGNRVSKTDYVYGVNLITYFTVPYKYNFTMYATIALLVGGAALVGLSKFKKDLMTVGGITFLLAMCMFILSKEFFQADEEGILEYAKVVGEYNAETQTLDVSFHGAELTWGAALGIAFSTIAFAFTTFSNQKQTVKEIAEEGVLIALAFVLNLIKIPTGPTGGSINFQMLPLMVIALRHGPARGFVAGGIIYGLLTCLTDGYGFACYPFDYLIGFGSIAIAGLFRKYIFGKDQTTYNVKGLIFIFVGGALSTIVRFVGSTVSSIVVYGYTLQAAVDYNLVYITVSGLIAIIGFSLMYGPLIQVNKHFKVEIDNKEEANAQ